MPTAPFVEAGVTQPPPPRLDENCLSESTVFIVQFHLMFI